MKISIVTISFNQAEFLERCILSVLEQDYHNIEYIVVDPGSTDGSRDIIEKYRDRISKIIYEPDKGGADGLNKGFAVATGDIYAYINSDDALLPHAISEVVSMFRKNTQYDIFIGHGYIVDAEGDVLRTFRSAKFTPRRFIYGAGTVMQQSTFFSAKAYMNSGGFNVHNRTSWDAELLLNMALKGLKIKMVNRYWSLFTIHENSITGTSHLPIENANNHSRYFKLVTGRKETKIDTLMKKIAWLLRWLFDPIGLGRRLLDRFVGPPKLSYPLTKDSDI